MKRLFPLVGATLLIAGVMGAIGFIVLTRYAPLPGIGGCRTIQNFQKRVDCVGVRSADAVKESDLADVLDRLESIADDSPQIEVVCHAAMHITARKLAPVKPADLEAAAAKTGRCASGFLHGAIQAAVTSGSRADIARVARLCPRSTGDNDDQRLRECYHGIGHGIARREDGFARALEQCHRVLNGREESVKCMGGAVMEATLTVDNPSAQLARKWCTDLDGDEATACYTYAQPFLDRTQAKQARSWCREAGDDLTTDMCSNYYGRVSLAKDTTSCNEFSGSHLDLYRWCVNGYFRENVHVSKFMSAREAANFCTDARRARRDACAQSFGTYVVGLGEAGIASSACTRYFRTPAMVTACESGRTTGSGRAMDIRNA